MSLRDDDVNLQSDEKFRRSEAATGAGSTDDYDNERNVTFDKPSKADNESRWRRLEGDAPARQYDTSSGNVRRSGSRDSFQRGGRGGDRDVDRDRDGDRQPRDYPRDRDRGFNRDRDGDGDNAGGGRFSRGGGGDAGGGRFTRDDRAGGVSGHRFSRGDDRATLNDPANPNIRSSHSFDRISDRGDRGEAYSDRGGRERTSFGRDRDRDRDRERAPYRRDEEGGSREERPGHLRFTRDAAPGAADNRPRRTLADLEKESSREFEGAGAAGGDESADVTTADTSAGIADVDTATAGIGKLSTSSEVRPSAHGPSIEPVRLGGGDKPVVDFAARQAARREQAERERAERGPPSDRFERGDRDRGEGGGRYGGDRESGRGGYGGRRGGYGDRDNYREGGGQISSSRFTRPDDGGGRYGDEERGERGGGRGYGGRGGRYGEGRHFDEGGGSGRGRYGGYGGARNFDLTDLPTKPAAAREAEYLAEQEKLHKPQPKKLEKAKAVTVVDPNDTSRYDASLHPAVTVVDTKKAVNPLQKAIDEKTSITAADLKNNINNIDLSKNTSTLADVLVRSLIDVKITLSDAIKSLQDSITDAQTLSTILTTTLSSYKQRRGDLDLLSLVRSSNVDVLPIIAPGVSDTELTDYLTKHDLLRLAPVKDISPAVNDALSSNQSPQDILSLIDSNVDSKLSLPTVRPAVATYVSKHIFSKTGTACKSDILAEWRPVLKRIVLRDRAEQILLVRELVSGWFSNGAAKGQLRDAFVNLHENNVIPAEAYKSWQEDTKDRSQAKMKALLQLNAWLSELQISAKPQEAEEEGDEEDDSDLQANPNLED